MKTIVLVLCALLQTSCVIKAQGFRVKANGPLPGRPLVTALAPDGTLYVAIGYGSPYASSLYKTNDDGQTWILVTTSSSSGPAKDSILGSIRSIQFAASGSIFVLTDDGLFRSTDNGSRWQFILFQSNPSRPVLMAVGRLFVVTNRYEQTRFTQRTFEFLNVSTDEGTTWSRVDSAELQNSSGVVSFYYDDRTGLLRSSGDGHILRSIDSGAHWQSFSTGHTTGFISFVTPNLDTIYSGCSGCGIYRSTDSAHSWTRIMNGLPDTIISCFAVNDRSWLYAGTANHTSDSQSQGVFRSTNGGQTWHRIDSGFTSWASYTVNSLLCSSSGKMYTMTNGGPFFSTNFGDHWKNIGRSVTGGFDGLFVSKGGLLYLASDGILVSSNQGQTWDGVTTRNMWLQAVVGDYLIATDYSGIIRSNDGGANWVVINKGLQLSDSDFSGNFGQIHQDNHGHLFIRTYPSLYVSSDSGNSWHQSISGVPQYQFEAYTSDAAGNIYAGGGNGVFLSTDEGLNWRQRVVGLSDTVVFGLTLDAQGVLFAATYGRKIFRSLNGGLSWEMVDTGTYAYAKLYSFGDAVYACASQPIKSTDEGMTWNLVDGSTANVPIDFMASAPNGYLYAAGYQGIWRSEHPMLNVVNRSLQPESPLALLANTPNPFNHTTTISFSLPEAGFVAIKLFDLTGREVSLIANRSFAQGENHVTFVASDLSPGVYFYRLTSGNQSHSRSFIVSH